MSQLLWVGQQCFPHLNRFGGTELLSVVIFVHDLRSQLCCDLPATRAHVEDAIREEILSDAKFVEVCWKQLGLPGSPIR